MGKKIETSPVSGGVELTIGPGSGRWQFLLAPLGLAGWAYGGYEALRGLPELQELLATGDTAGVFSPLFGLGVFVLAAASAPSLFLYNLFGAEFVSVVAGRMMVGREFRGRRLFARSFNTLEVENLRMGEDATLSEWLRRNPFRLTLSTGEVAFDARGKTYRFGQGLEESEAERVVARIQEHLPASAVRCTL